MLSSYYSGVVSNVKHSTDRKTIKNSEGKIDGVKTDQIASCRVDGVELYVKGSKIISISDGDKVAFFTWKFGNPKKVKFFYNHSNGVCFGFNRFGLFLSMLILAGMGYYLLKSESSLGYLTLLHDISISGKLITLGIIVLLEFLILNAFFRHNLILGKLKNSIC